MPRPTVMIHEDNTECDLWPAGTKKLLKLGKDYWCTQHQMHIERSTREEWEEFKKDAEINEVPSELYISVDGPPATGKTSMTLGFGTAMHEAMESMPPFQPKTNLEMFQQQYWWRARDEGWIPIKGMELDHLRNVYLMMAEDPKRLTTQVLHEIKAKLQAFYLAAGAHYAQIDIKDLMQASQDMVWIEKWPADWIQSTPLFKMFQSMAVKA